MVNPKVEFQAREYLFDLNNTAKEHWFKAGEEWELCLVTASERLVIEKKYNPTISTWGLPETLTQLYGLVKGKLAQPSEGGKRAQVDRVTSNKDCSYLMAFNPDRLR